MTTDPLALDPDQMRRMGYAAIDMLVHRIAGLPDGPVLRTASRAEMAGLIDEPPPSGARDFNQLLERLDRDVLPFVGHFDHPRFFGYIPGAGTWPAALGDLIASATNVDAGAWREAAGPSQLELTVLDWFRGWIGYPAGAAGVLVSGGSAANLTAIACAREALVGPMSPRIVAYTSDQTHSSLARAARHLGFRPDQIRVLPTDEAFRLRPPMSPPRWTPTSPRAASRSSSARTPARRARVPSTACRSWPRSAASAGCGSTSTARTGRSPSSPNVAGRRSPGLELADSVTLDPHKWLAMPFEVGCLMVRDAGVLERAFELHPEYLQESAAVAHGVNFADRGLQLTRASRAIKVWLAIQAFGVDAFREVIDRALDLTVAAQRWIEADPRLELVTPASLGVLTFRRRGPAGRSDVDGRPRQRGRRGHAGGGRRRAGDLDRHRGAVRDPPVRAQPFVGRGRRPPRARARRHGRGRCGRHARPGDRARRPAGRRRTSPGSMPRPSTRHGWRRCRCSRARIRRGSRRSSGRRREETYRPARRHPALGAGAHVLPRARRPPVGQRGRHRGERAGTGRPPRRDRGDRLGARLQLRPDGDGRRHRATPAAGLPGRGVA